MGTIPSPSRDSDLKHVLHISTGTPMRHLVEQIIASYERRVQMVGALMKRSTKWLEAFRREQEEMAVKLREHLARAESLRYRDFDRLMQQIWIERRETEKEVIQAVEDWQRDEEEIVAQMKRILAGDECPTPEDFRAMQDTILTRQKEREHELGELLKRILMEQEQLSAALTKLLAKGEQIRIKDFKAMLSHLSAWRRYRDSNMAWTLEECEKVRQQVEAEWQQVIRISDFGSHQQESAIRNPQSAIGKGR